MIIDSMLLLSHEQDLGAGSASLNTQSTNVIDLEAALNDLGAAVSHNVGESGIKANIFVDGEAFTCLSNPGQITIEVMTKASPSSLASGTVIGTLAIRTLTAAATGAYNVDGAALYQGELPHGNYLRYLYLNYTGTTKMTAGKVTAALSLDAPTQVANK